MSVRIESLESRLFLSASPATISADGGALLAAGTTLRADLKTAGKGAVADVRTLAADLKRSKAPKAAKTAQSTLTKDQKKNFAALNKPVNRLLPLGASELKAAGALFKKLQKNPTSTALQSKLRADVAKLQSLVNAAAPKITAAASAASASGQADVADVAAANASDAKTQTDASTAGTNAAGVATTIQADVTRLQNAANTLVADVG